MAVRQRLLPERRAVLGLRHAALRRGLSLPRERRRVRPRDGMRQPGARWGRRVLRELRVVQPPLRRGAHLHGDGRPRRAARPPLSTIDDCARRPPTRRSRPSFPVPSRTDSVARVRQPHVRRRVRCACWAARAATRDAIELHRCVDVPSACRGAASCPCASVCGAPFRHGRSTARCAAPAAPEALSAVGQQAARAPLRRRSSPTAPSPMMNLPTGVLVHGRARAHEVRPSMRCAQPPTPLRTTRSAVSAASREGHRYDTVMRPAIVAPSGSR
jgi:hypothetical protein